METLREIARYVRPASRVAEAGAGGAARALTGGEAVASWASVDGFLASGAAGFDALAVPRRAIDRARAEALAARLDGRALLVVDCSLDTGRRILDDPSMAELVTTLTEARWSLLAPSRWLAPPGSDRLFVVARPDLWTIRGYRPGDESAIRSLFATSFGHARAEAWWRWEFEENPHGRHAISLAFDPEGELVAQYAAYPVPLRSVDATLDGLHAHQIGDVMTAFSVRGVGRGHTSLLVRTARHFFATRCAGTVAFNYGFLTGSHRALSSSFVESALVEPVPFRRAEIGALRLPRGLTRAATTLLGGYRVEPVEAIDEEWDRFLDAAVPAYRLLVRRDARYLRWRYFGHPELRYAVFALRSRGKLAGWGVFRRQGDALVWGDALFAPEHARGAALLLEQALGSTTGAGATRVEGWFPSRPAHFARALDAIGLPLVPEPHDLTVMCTPFRAGDAAARIARDLYYSFGDSDLF